MKGLELYQSIKSQSIPTRGLKYYLAFSCSLVRNSSCIETAGSRKFHRQLVGLASSSLTTFADATESDRGTVSVEVDVPCVPCLWILLHVWRTFGDFVF